jgi:hypothetical protein
MKTSRRIGITSSCTKRLNEPLSQRRWCPNFKISDLTGAQPSRLPALRDGQARTLALQSKPSRLDFRLGHYRKGAFLDMA